MAIDLTAKTKLTTITGAFEFVVVDKSEAATANKPKLVAPESVGRKALMNTRTVSGASATLGEDDNNTIVRFTNTSLVTVTLDKDNPIGWSCQWVQEGAGQLQFVVESGGSALHHYQGHDASSGVQWSAGTLEVIANSGGAAAIYLLLGVTANA
jgi:hypothetical protein